MPSQEDYLDRLLKDLGENIEQESENGEEESIFVDEKPVLLEGEPVSVGENDTFAGEELVSTGKNNAFAGEDPASTWEDNAFAGEDPASVDENDAFAGEESASVDENDTFAGEESASVGENDAFAGEESASTEEVPVFTKEAPVLEDVDGMTEEEIIRLLSMSNDFGENPFEAKEDSGDVLELLSDTGDADLQAIQELLEKSDSNETIEDFDGDAAEKETSEPVEASDSVIADKRQKRREQMAARKAERVAAKEAKAAAKAAAREARAAKKKTKSVESVESEPEIAVGDGGNLGLEEEEPFDTSLLDTIVSEADKAGYPEYETDYAQGAEHKADFARNEELSGRTETIDEGAEGVDSAMGALSDMGFGASDDFDLNSLFGDSGGEAALGNAVGETGFSDLLSSDESETDDMLENISRQGDKEKKGFFTKLVDFFTEEDEEESENEDIPLSDENKEILEGLDRDKGEGKKKKKNKKSKKKGKEAGNEENGEEKPVKKKKPKKEKKKKQEESLEDANSAPVIPEKKLSLKKVIPVMLIALSLGVLIIVFVNSAAEYADKKAAREAYYEGDYQTCFQNLYGKDRNESEQIMYAKSESILYIRLWLREYEMFAEEGSELEALDSLIQTVDHYPALYEYAVQWNAGSEVAAGYAEILSILSEKYGLTEEQAQAIADEPDDAEYTRMVLAMTQGKKFGSWNEPEISAMPESSPLEDVLPEEAELGKEIFINNQ